MTPVNWLRTRWRAALRTRAGRFGIALVCIVFAIAALEGALRLFGVAPLAESGVRGEPWFARLLEPGKCSTSGGLENAFFVEVCANQLGLRDRNHAPGESPRVLVLGDSFTFGSGVEQADTFAAVFERELRVALQGTRAGVFNAGAVSTSQAHQELLLHHLWAKVNPDVVVLAFAEDDDIDQNIVQNPALSGASKPNGALIPPATGSEAPGGGAPGALLRHSALARFLDSRELHRSYAAEADALEARLTAHGLTATTLGTAAEHEPRRRFVQAFGEKYEHDFSVTEILLERIRRFVTDNRKKLALLRIPSRVSIDDSAWAAARQRFCGNDANASQSQCGGLDRARTAHRLAQHAATHRLVHIDPESDLRAAIERGEAVYLPGGVHLSRLGHSIVGTRLSEVLVPLLGGTFERASAAGTPAGGKRRSVGAYWYPWYRSKDWSTITDYTPKGGAYRSNERAAVARQLYWAERAELDFLMIELLADHNPESLFNNQAVNAMVSAVADRRRRGHSRLKFAMLSDISIANADIVTSERWLEESKKHLDQIWTRFVEPYPDAYLRVQGKPLVGIFSPPAAIDDARFTVIRPYWVSHEQWSGWDRRKELIPFWDTYPQNVTDPRFVSVVPGYNDWRLEREPQVAPYLPRQGGRTFAEQWRRVFEVSPDLVLVYSFNEYFEQTQIEPTVEHGDRYLLLNQIFARRFKEGRPVDAAQAAKLVDALEPPPGPAEEKVDWLPITDPRVVRTGLEELGGGRAALRDRAELKLDVRSETAFVIGVGHAPSFDRCAGLSVAVSGAGDQPPRTFSTELSQLSILRDLALPKATASLTLVLRRVAKAADCPDAGAKPIVLTGIARYPFSALERLSFDVADSRVTLEGFWAIETVPEGPFVWSRGSSTITLSNLEPGGRHRVTLTFRDTGNFESLQIGTDPQHLERVAITPARTASLAEPVRVSPRGTLKLHFKSGIWTPRQRFGSEDPRTLGVALRLITLERAEGEAPDQAR